MCLLAKCLAALVWKPARESCMRIRFNKPSLPEFFRRMSGKTGE